MADEPLLTQWFQRLASFGLSTDGHLRDEQSTNRFMEQASVCARDVKLAHPHLDADAVAFVACLFALSDGQPHITIGDDDVWWDQHDIIAALLTAFGSRLRLKLKPPGNLPPKITGLVVLEAVRRCDPALLRQVAESEESTAAFVCDSVAVNAISATLRHSSPRRHLGRLVLKWLDEACGTFVSSDTLACQMAIEELRDLARGDLVGFALPISITTAFG